jgi:hypothetical protein
MATVWHKKTPTGYEAFCHVVITIRPVQSSMHINCPKLEYHLKFAILDPRIWRIGDYE